MTGVAVHNQKESKANGPSLLASTSAFSSQTREIADRVQALQSRPSPGSLPSLPPAAVSASAELPLEERLFEALASAKILTSQVAMHLDRDWRDKLFHQLDALHDTAEWEQGDLPIQAPSFVTFLKAMLSIDPERRPGLGLSNTGHLIAAWTTGKDRLTIEFLAHDRIRWVLSRSYEGETERFAGETNVARLADGLANYQPGHWFSHAAKSHELA